MGVVSLILSPVFIEIIFSQPQIQVGQLSVTEESVYAKTAKF